MKIGKVQPTPVKVPQRIERKIKEDKPIPVELPKKPVKKEQNVPA